MSASGDEHESPLIEPVRRTRSGRTHKTTVVAKKSPAKKLLARATRSPKKLPELEEIEESVLENVEDTGNVPENGVEQRLRNMIRSANDDARSALRFQLEDPPESSVHEMQDIETNLQELTGNEDNIQEYHTEVQHEVQIMSEDTEVPELEAPPPPVMNNIPNTCISSTLKLKESSELMECQIIDADTIVLEDNALDRVDSNSAHAIIIEESSIDASTDEQSVMIDLEQVIHGETRTVGELLEAENVDSQDVPVGEGIEVMEVDGSDAEISQLEMTTEQVDLDMLVTTTDNDEEPPKRKKILIETSEEVTEKIEPDTEAVSEDELPTEAAAKEPETEAVSDEELPAAATADLGETESVSEDELPLESDKKRKGAKLAKNPEKKAKVEGGSKRKLNAEGEYDPSSPTSENNDETPAKKVALAVEADPPEKPEVRPASPKKTTLPELDKYWKAVQDDPSDFTGWTYLLQYVDQENDAEAAREAYTKFLERYPYCYGYWRKYADYEKKKGSAENVQMVFDQGLKAISLSVDLWIHYINHCKTVHEKDEDKLREQYERAIEACGLEFRSDRLWESYIKWEMEGKRFNRVTGLYDRLLRTPTLGYKNHFDSFQTFVTSNPPNRILNVDDFLALRTEVKALLKTDDTTVTTDDTPPGEEPSPQDVPPTDEETRAIVEKIISSRRKVHKANVHAVAGRWKYEEGIKRPYFHVKPLELCQLKNWKEYLDYEIEQKDQNRIIILFERCLIACALYDEFWMRLIRYLESLKGDNVEQIRDVYTRACTVHHPKKPNLHLQWATFEEDQGNFDKAASILENIDSVIPNLLQVAYRRINLERRRNDLDKACTLYEHYITNSKNRTIANNIAVKYARFLCKIRNDVDQAVKVLLKATEKDKDNRRLYLQLIDMGLQRNPVDTQEIVGYMDMFIEREHADLKQRVSFAQRKVEFLEDFSTDIRQVLKAHEQFQECFKQANERTKTKNEENKTDSSPPKKAKTEQSSVPATPSVGSQSSYQYSSGPSGPYQSQQFQSGQYGSQSGYQQGYQQYPPPSDPNYANYQNWQYSQSGPQAYGPYNQWGSYYTNY